MNAPTSHRTCLHSRVSFLLTCTVIAAWLLFSQGCGLNPATLFATPTPTATATSTPTQTPTPTITPSPTPTYTPTPIPPDISGVIVAKGDAPIQGRRIVLCKMSGELALPTPCTFEKTYATTDEQGNFTFDDVEPGQYMIFYDSNWSDFDEGLAKWGGQEIRVGDVQWLVDNFYEKNADGQYEMMIPADTALGPNLMASLALQFYFRSSFFFAYTSETTAGEFTVKPVIADIRSAPAQVTFTVNYHGD